MIKPTEPRRRKTVIIPESLDVVDQSPNVQTAFTSPSGQVESRTSDPVASLEVMPQRDRVIVRGPTESLSAVTIVREKAPAVRSGVTEKKSVHRPNAQKGFWIAIAAVLAFMVAGPPLFLIAQALAYPLVILLCALALWKLYDFFRPMTRNTDREN